MIEWRPIPGWPEYEVSNPGAMVRKVSTGKELMLYANPDGRVQVRLAKSRYQRSWRSVIALHKLAFPELYVKAPKYPAGGPTAPKQEGNPVEKAISNGFAAVCAVLRYGYQQVEKAVNLCDERLVPGIVWRGRLFYLVEDVEIGSACEQCGIRTLCERLTEYDDRLCEILSGDSDHHFVMLTSDIDQGGRGV